MGWWNREPAVLLGLLNAGLALGVGFGLPMTPSQATLLNAFMAALLGFVTRSQVSPINR